MGKRRLRHVPRHSELPQVWDGDSLRYLWGEDRDGANENARAERATRQLQRIMVLRAMLASVKELILEGRLIEALMVIDGTLSEIEDYSDAPTPSESYSHSPFGEND